ncbi:MAG: prolyl oligopeptidase family serine peptidase [Clostridia bacterium]|nr:prolyl oligopeptidase family serine peptidase [Clostridia bacterium]
MIIERKVFNGLRYKVAYPNGFKENKKYPVLFFMHGAGERGDDLDIIDTYGVFREIHEGKEFEFICVAPQCEKDIVWYDKLPLVKEFVNHYVAHNFVDEKMIFLSGISMGGYMSWQLLMSLPDIFKKAVIFCGGGMYWNAKKIKTEVWAFHGRKDKTVYVEESIKMVEAINASGGKAKLTILEHAEHNCWTEIYREKQMYKWLFE